MTKVEILDISVLKILRVSVFGLRRDFVLLSFLANFVFDSLDFENQPLPVAGFLRIAAREKRDLGHICFGFFSDTGYRIPRFAI